MPIADHATASGLSGSTGRWHRRLILLAALLLATGGAGAVEYTLRSLTPTNVDGLTGEASVTAGHFDGDRRADMAMCFRRLQVNLYTQDAAGEQVLRHTEKLWEQTIPPYGGAPYQIWRCRMHVLDLDANGVDDLVVTHSMGALVLKMFPDGSVQRQEVARRGGIFVAGDGFWDSAVADFDGDGDMDLVGIRDVGRVVSRLTNLGDGRLSDAVDVGTVVGPWENGARIAAGDLDGDGAPDLAVAVSINGTGSTVFLHNDGRGGLSERAGTRIQHPTGYGFTYLEAADVTGDGKDDLVLVNASNRPNSVLLVYEQDGNGTLKPYEAYPAYDIPQSIAIQDLDGDGRNDIMLLHPSWTAITTYLQRSDGYLDIHGIVDRVYNSQDGYNLLALRDFRGDGCKDALIATQHYSWADGTNCLPASNADVGTLVQVGDGSVSLQVENRDLANAAFSVVATLRLDSTGITAFFPPAPEGCTVSAANVNARIYVCRIARLEPGEIRTYALPYRYKGLLKGRFRVGAVARVNSHGDDPQLANNAERRDYWQVKRAPTAVQEKRPATLSTPLPPRPVQRPSPRAHPAPAPVRRAPRATN